MNFCTVNRAAQDQLVNALLVDKGGLKLRESAPDSADPVPDRNAQPCPAQSTSCFPRITNNNGEQVVMTPVARGIQTYSSASIGIAIVTHSPGGTRIEAPHTTLGGLATMLQPMTLLSVVDMRGSQSRYQVSVETSLDMNALMSPLLAAAQAASAAGGPGNPAANADFAALTKGQTQIWPLRN